jgi:hypothetical protein
VSLLDQPVFQTLPVWLPGYCRSRAVSWLRPTPKRIWVVFADHFEPWWRRADERTALGRVQRWVHRWPAIARRHADSRGRPPCYTFFYPVEQYHAGAIDSLATLHRIGLGDIEVHLHHDGDTEQQFVEQLSGFIASLHTRHGLLATDGNRPVFGFIHGNWALDNSLPDGKFCGLNNEIALLRDLGCYADFTLPAAPSPAQTRMVNTIYWATDDTHAPKSHDSGIPLMPRSGIAGDLLIVPGPLTINIQEWNRPLVPRLEVGELAGNCLATRHRVELWLRVAPQVGDDQFLKVFAHGAPEKNAEPMLADGGVLDRTLTYLEEESARQGVQLFFVSAWQMWQALDAIRRGADPVTAVEAPRTNSISAARAS